MQQTGIQKVHHCNKIAMLTDFGLKDPFAGIMKGAIYSINQEAVIIDLTHQITSHDVFEGAFCLYESYKFFPLGTIFLCVVDPGVGGKRKGIIIQTSEYYFIGPDNGLLSLAVKDCENPRVYEISNDEYLLKEISSTFHGRDIFTPVAAHLSKGIEPGIIGNRINSFNKIQLPVVKRTGNCLEAEIIYIDKFGNLITNVENSISDKIKNIKIRDMHIKKISASYENGEPGKAIALKGSAGFIEIAVNSGSAEKSFTVNKGDIIYIDILNL